MDTVPMTLTDFLLARLSEDEAVARDVIAERGNLTYREGREPEVPDMDVWADVDAMNMHVAVGAERVLAECAAKRRIIAMSDGGADFEAAMPTPGYAQPYHSPSVDVLTMTRRLLALAYSGHADYRDEWRPTE